MPWTECHRGIRAAASDTPQFHLTWVRKQEPSISCPPWHGHRANLQPLLAHPSYRGREEALEAAGWWGVIHEYRSTRDAGDMGGGCPPAGAILHRYSVRVEHHLSRFQARDSSQILFLPRARLSGPISNHCPPPYSGREEWLIDSSHRKTFTWSGGDSRLPPHIPMPRNDGKSIFQVR
jgi:hypothetical protein